MNMLIYKGFSSGSSTPCSHFVDIRQTTTLKTNSVTPSSTEVNTPTGKSYADSHGGTSMDYR